MLDEYLVKYHRASRDEVNLKNHIYNGKYFIFYFCKWNFTPVRERSAKTFVLSPWFVYFGWCNIYRFHCFLQSILLLLSVFHGAIRQRKTVRERAGDRMWFSTTEMNWVFL